MGAFEIIIATTIIAEVIAAPWTLEQPEVRLDAHKINDHGVTGKSTEESNTLYGNFHRNNPESYGIKYDDVVDYVKDDDSDGPDMGRYAEEYEYQSYMEKKVTNLVHSGSKYLEGLRRALEQYYLTLEQCERMNLTDTQNSTPNQINLSSLPMPSNVSSLPFSDLPMSPDFQNLTRSNLTLEKCKELSERSERVRRIAQLALHTTTMLQERVHTQKYAEHEDDYDIEDRALIIRLAWFLDKLAELTGYDPDVQEYMTTTTVPPTQSTSLPDMASFSIVPDDIKLAMLECLKNTQNSPDPATVRCNFPVTYPAFMQQIFNVSDSSSAQSSDVASSISNDESETPFSKDADSDSSDISEIHDHNLKEEFPPKETSVKNDLPLKFTSVKHVQKRSLPDNNPLHNIVNYYAKYKVWANINPDTASGEILNEIHDGNSIEKEQDFEKQRGKRSAYRVAYYQRKTMLRVPQATMQKLDYFYKNKPGTSINPDPVQAAQVRAGLERIFQNGNIEVLRRYGSNYNPAVPNQLIAGLIPTIVDTLS